MPLVSLLYTAALEGQLALLPVLFTRIRQERAAIHSHGGVTILADLGRSCMPGDWLCETTDGRGMLVAMDAMGYDAFHIGPQDLLYKRPATVQQLRVVIQTGLAAGPWMARVQRSDLQFAFAANERALPAQVDLGVVLRLSDQPTTQAIWQGTRRQLVIDPGMQALTHRPADQPLLGRLDMALHDSLPYIEILNQTQLDLPPDMLPDPTISGVVEFVESEARYAEHKRGPHEPG